MLKARRLEVDTGLFMNAAGGYTLQGVGQKNIPN